MRRHRSGWYSTAAVLGLLHALPSVYWALGGTWLLSTVGPWAEELHRRQPIGAGMALLAVAAVKAAVALLPLLVHRGRWPAARRRWRGLSWVAAVILIGYGLANEIAGALALSGVWGDVEHPAAVWGHVCVWDPLFALWGAALAAGLWSDRPGVRPRPAPGSLDGRRVGLAVTGVRRSAAGCQQQTLGEAAGGFVAHDVEEDRGALAAGPSRAAVLQQSAGQ